MGKCLLGKLSAGSLVVAPDVPALDGVEGDIDVLVSQVGVVRQVLEDLGHDLPAVVRVLEEVEQGNVDPEKVPVMSV